MLVFPRETLRQTVKDYILSLNFGYKKALRDKAVEYINAYASFVDPHTVEYTTVVRLNAACMVPNRHYHLDFWIVLIFIPSGYPFQAKRSQARLGPPFSDCRRRPT